MTEQVDQQAWDRQSRLEQYKLCVEMADRVSQRRMVANTLFATLTTSIIGALVVLGSKPEARSFEVGLCLVGILLAAAWRVHVVHSQRLNSAKFQVIQKIELELPCQPFAEEWTLVRTHPAGYIGHSRIEAWVPVVAALVFAGILLTLAKF